MIGRQKHVDKSSFKQFFIQFIFVCCCRNRLCHACGFDVWFWGHLLFRTDCLIQMKSIFSRTIPVLTKPQINSDIDGNQNSCDNFIINSVKKFVFRVNLKALIQAWTRWLCSKISLKVDQDISVAVELTKRTKKDIFLNINAKKMM